MVGLSTFFSSTFHNIFQAQRQTSNVSRQFAANEIIRNKFLTLNNLIEETGLPDPSILTLNKVTKGQLPFSFIGSREIDGDQHLVFKDVLVFNKIENIEDEYRFANSGANEIKTIGQPGVSHLRKELINFTSFTKLEDKYYVVAKHENKVYVCDEEVSNCSSTLTFDPPLLSPTDITSNGNDTLFISDSENGFIRNYNIESDEQVIIATNLKYPVGLAYYNNGYREYLFFADTLDNKIYKIDASDPVSLTVIAGAGPNKNCDNTASFCKLNLPTGLYADSDNHALYIADSGNNRILKISDPTLPDIDNYEVNVELDSNITIGHIDFEISGADLTNATESEPNTLHSGIYSSTDSTITLEFSVPIANSYLFNKECMGEPEVCTNYFDQFTVLEENLIFTPGDKILLGSDPTIFTANFNIDNPQTNPPTIPITPDDVRETAFAPGTIAKINNTFNAGTYIFRFDLSNATLTSGFQTLKIKIFDSSNNLVQENSITLRIGDGELGTSEDKIEVIAADFIDGNKITFPTGVSDKYFANSGEKTIVTIENGSTIPLNPINTEEFSTFDYISDFTLEDMIFNKYNSKSILQLDLNAYIDVDNSQNYKINAHLN